MVEYSKKHNTKSMVRLYPILGVPSTESPRLAKIRLEQRVSNHDEENVTNHGISSGIEHYICKVTVFVTFGFQYFIVRCRRAVNRCRYIAILIIARRSRGRHICDDVCI